MFLRSRHNSAWSLDSPDELAALERLDPNLRGLADNPVFRYLRYRARRKLPLKMSMTPLTLVLGVVGVVFLGPYLFKFVFGHGRTAGVISNMANQVIVMLVLQHIFPARRFSGPLSAVDLNEVRKKSEALEFVRIDPQDISGAVWGMFIQLHQKRAKPIITALSLITLLIPFIWRGHIAVFGMCAAAGIAGLYAGSARMVCSIGLRAAEFRVRLLMINERELMPVMGMPAHLWKRADRALERQVIQGHFGFCIALILALAIAANVALAYSAPGLGLGGVRLSMVGAAMSVGFAGLGFALAFRAFRINAPEYDRLCKLLKKDSETLVEMWRFRAQALGAETPENAKGYGQERVKMPAKRPPGDQPAARSL